VKRTRTGALCALALTTAIATSGCGSDDNASAARQSSASQDAEGMTCAKGSLTGAGSSAQKNAVDEWVKNYQSRCSGSTVNYQSVGSGAGISQFTAGTVDFAGSDSALKDAEQPAADKRCGTGSAIHLPMVVGPVGIAYNLPGVKGLVLDGPTTAKIFSGTVTTWNDPAIGALNPGTSLPATTIQPFHRSDSSGTTDNVTKYLAAAGGAGWTFGAGKEWKAPGGQGAKGNEGVSAAVKQTPGAVGYLELSYIENSGLPAAKIATGASSPVALSAASAGKAVEAAKLVGTGNDLKLSIDYATKADGVYPIVLVTYEIVCEKGTPADKLALLKGFLGYAASQQGQSDVANLGYAPLPASFLSKVRTAVTALS
jgi:phosphate transport system substrate-binding protein